METKYQTDLSNKIKQLDRYKELSHVESHRYFQLTEELVFQDTLLLSTS